MSVMAAGLVQLEVKESVPENILNNVKKNINLKVCDSLKSVKKYINLKVYDSEYEADFNGNWRLDDVTDALKPLNPYIKAGHISYWSDEGDGCADFVDGEWCEEWEEKYYPSELPTYEISETPRVAEILNVIADSLMKLSDSTEATRILFDDCKLTDDEIQLYNLEWLKDLTDK